MNRELLDKFIKAYELDEKAAKTLSNIVEKAYFEGGEDAIEEVKRFIEEAK